VFLCACNSRPDLLQTGFTYFVISPFSGQRLSVLTSRKSNRISLVVVIRTSPRGSSGFMGICTRFLILLASFSLPFASLNPLPFASNVFDFVRIRYIGLAVPENKVESSMPHN